MEEIFILSGARTAIGSFGGGLASFRPAETGAMVMKEAIARAGIAPDLIGQVVLGNVIPTQPADFYLSRVASVNAGIPIESVAMNVNRLCGSGLQALVSAAQAIKLGECDFAIGAGAESMSNAPHMTSAARFGTKMGAIELADAMLGSLHDPFQNIHMGITAENVAEACQITRADQDEAAVESHRRAANAIAQGYFREQILPVEIKTRKGITMFDTDEHVRADASVESMASLKPVFKKDGTVTAGNILTAVAMLVALLAWGFRLEGQVAAERVERTRMEAEIGRRLEADGQRERDGFAELRAGLRRIEDILLRSVSGASPPPRQ